MGKGWAGSSAKRIAEADAVEREKFKARPKTTVPNAMKLSGWGTERPQAPKPVTKAELEERERQRLAEQFRNRPKSTVPDAPTIADADRIGVSLQRPETATERRERERLELLEAYEARGGATTEAEDFAITGGAGPRVVYERNETAAERREREAAELREAYESRGAATTEAKDFDLTGGSAPKEVYWRNETEAERRNRETEEMREAYEARKKQGPTTSTEEFSVSKGWKPKPQDLKENETKSLAQVQREYGRNSRKEASASAAGEKEKYRRRVLNVS